MFCNPHIFDGVEPNGTAIGVVRAMVDLIPPDTPPIDGQVARVLLAKRFSSWMIAEYLDEVIEQLERRAAE